MSYTSQAPTLNESPRREKKVVGSTPVEVKKLKCHECGLAFMNRDNLKAHMMKRHNVHHQKRSEPISSDEVSRIYLKIFLLFELCILLN